MPWRTTLNVDPIPALLAWQDPALDYFIRRDLLDEAVPSIDSLWGLAEPKRLVEKQQPNGSWRYPGGRADSSTGTNYELLETFRTLGLLVWMYGLNRDHSAIRKAAEYVFSNQTAEGDIRGILGNQYMPYYHGAILTLLIKAGLLEDPRVHAAMEWLLSMRQYDGGWIIPAQAVPAKEKTRSFWLGPALPPFRDRPFSHLATDMVLRPFAAHPDYRSLPQVLAAASLLGERIFQPDKYNDRKGAGYWLKFQFPFWWHSLVATLDSLSHLGLDRSDRYFSKGLDWFTSNQCADGLWETGYGCGSKSEGMRHWVGLAVCRVIKRSFKRG